MSQCTYKLAVLYNRRARHSLNYASCFFYQFVVGNANNHIFLSIAFIIAYAYNFYIVFLRLTAVHGTNKGGTAFFYLLHRGDGILPCTIGDLCKCTVYSAIRVAQQSADGLALKITLKRACCTPSAFFYFFNGCTDSLTVKHWHNFLCVNIIYLMTERRKYTAVLIIKCDCAYACCGITHPHTCLVASLALAVHGS